MDIAAAVLFALLAGAGTALSPCVLPVLPIALAAGATGGRRRPLGVALGLAGSLTVAVIALAYVIGALGLPDSLLRDLAIAVLLGFGVALVVPPLGGRLEALLSRAAPRVEGRAGMGSGLVLGACLGLVYAPCAGPVLAAVITVSASQSLNGARAVVGAAYGCGAAAALLVLMVFGRRLTARLAPRSGRLQQGLGAVMVVLAVAMAFGLDARFQTAVAARAPAFLVDPTRAVEGGGAVRRAVGGAPLRASAGGSRLAAGRRLPVLGRAPDFAEVTRWLNTPGGRPLSLRGSLRGRVVLIDFWTYTCINCLRTLPYLRAWDAAYRRAGLTIVGVHTPEFPFERSTANVARAVRADHLRYPVAQDNDYGTWSAYGNQFWPASYLVDARGRVRYTHFGEGGDTTTERAIRSLLAERGTSMRAAPVAGRVRAQRPSPGQRTPETYLGADRAERFRNGPIVLGARDFGPVDVALRPDELAYRGAWRIGHDSATALGRAGVALRFESRRVFLVLGGRGAVRVALDGRPIPPAAAGADVRGGAVRVRGQRLYRLVDLPRVEEHTLQLRFAPGVAGYAFTFG